MDDIKLNAYHHYNKAKHKLKYATAEIELQEVIEEFEVLFSLLKVHNDDVNYPFLSDNELEDAYQCCGLTYLKLLYTPTVTKTGKAISQAIIKFQNAASQHKKKSNKHESSNNKWETIKICYENCIEKYKLGLREDISSEVFFKELIEKYFGEAFYCQASAEKVKIAILEIGCDINIYSQEILEFYARFFEYRGYSYIRGAEINNCKRPKKLLLFHAKSDLEKSLNIYKEISDKTDMHKYKNTINNINEKILHINKNHQIYRGSLLSFFSKLLRRFFASLSSSILVISGYIQMWTGQNFSQLMSQLSQFISIPKMPKSIDELSNILANSFGIKKK